jgi:hypothetical protein
MFASKPLLSPSKLRLPAVSKPDRRRFQSPSNPSDPTMESPTISENVSALKAKYTDYAMWLKASSRQNREPIFTHELLKHSLCEMGIDSTQAEQLVSTCSWYVYQFHKELGADTEQHTNQSITTETKKTRDSSKKRHKKIRTSKSKATHSSRDHSSESTATITSTNKGEILTKNPKNVLMQLICFSLENLHSSGSSSPIRNKFSVLPAIQPSDPSLSPRSRHVDFDNEQSIEKQKPSHWRSALSKARVLPKLRQTESELSVHNDDDAVSELTSIDFDLSSSQKSLHRPGARRTRSILRKQISSCSSEVSEVTNRRNRNRTLTPSSIIADEIPLGTKSQRLFGGSKCFAEIMNELEEQKLH